VPAHGREDQDRLARNGNAKVLDQNQADDREVAEAVERRFETVQNARRC